MNWAVSEGLRVDIATRRMRGNIGVTTAEEALWLLALHASINTRSVVRRRGSGGACRGVLGVEAGCR